MTKDIRELRAIIAESDDELDYSDEEARLSYENDDDEEAFYVGIKDKSNKWIAKIAKSAEGGKWFEETVSGDPDYNFGGKNYMGYLTPQDIMTWLYQDYEVVEGPFDSPDEIDLDMLEEEMGPGLEDLPTGEYELCPHCYGDDPDCPHCEAGLIDRTGEYERPDFSDMEGELTERNKSAEIHLTPKDVNKKATDSDTGHTYRSEKDKDVKKSLKDVADRYKVEFVDDWEDYMKVDEDEKPYATMDDGPEDYLYKKGKKQKLVGEEEFEDEDMVEAHVMSGPADIEVDGFHLMQEREVEPDQDNAKIWHTVTLPDGEEVYLDHSPYEYLDTEDFQVYVDYYHEHGHFPNRWTIKSNAPLNKEDLRTIAAGYDMMNENKKDTELAEIIRLSGIKERYQRGEEAKDSPFTHSSHAVDEIRGEAKKDYSKFDNELGDHSLFDEVQEEDDFDIPEFDAAFKAAKDAGYEPHSMGWTDRGKVKLDTNKGLLVYDPVANKLKTAIRSDEAEMEEDFLVPPKNPDRYDSGNEESFDYEDDDLEDLEEEDGPDTKAKVVINPRNEEVYYVLSDNYGALLDFGKFEDQILVPGTAEEVERMLSTFDFTCGEDYEIEDAVDEDLNNGYGKHHKPDPQDYFPQGAVSNPADAVGPSAARHGDNPRRATMRAVHSEDEEVYESMKKSYRRFRNID